jgi:hypothetical protein
MATSAKRQANTARLLKKLNGEPTIDAMNYNPSLMLALNWYNTEADNKTKKRWFQEHFGKNARFAMADINDREFRTVGTLCRIVDNQQYLDPKELALIQSEFERIKSLSDQAKAVPVKQSVAVPLAKAPTIQDRLDDQASEFVGKFDEMIDAFTLDRKAIPDVALLMKQRPTSPVAKKAMAKISRVLEELREAVAGTDKQLNEGYSNFKKPELKKLLAAYESLAEQLEQTKKMVVRVSTRKPKVKPAGQVVAKMKFAKENTELGLKSVPAASIVDAEEVWLFNTKYKKLQYYKAVDGMRLTVKGTTIMNFDATKSEQLTVRKPETVATLNDKGKRAFTQFVKTLTTKPAPCNGRTSEETIILAAFK